MNATVNGDKNKDHWGAQQSFHRLHRSINNGVDTHPDIRYRDGTALKKIANILYTESRRMMFSNTMFDKEDIARRVQPLVADISDTALLSNGWDEPYIREE